MTPDIERQALAATQAVVTARLDLWEAKTADRQRAVVADVYAAHALRRSINSIVAKALVEGDG